MSQVRCTFKLKLLDAQIIFELGVAEFFALYCTYIFFLVATNHKVLLSELPQPPSE